LFERIVVPAQAPAGSDVLLADMIELARLTGAKLSAVLPPASGPAGVEEWFQRAGSIAGSESARLFSATAAKSGAEGLLEYAEGSGADLLALPSTRCDWLGKRLPAWVTRSVAGSSCPVWVSGRTPVLQERSGALGIICAVDLLPGCDAVIDVAARLQHATGGTVVLSYVVPVITEGSLVDSLLLPGMVLSADVARERLGALRETRIPEAGIEVLTGSPAAQIQKLSGEFPRAIVVTGRHGQRIGSTATRVLRSQRSALMVVPV
jgi:nucleotide-binding universal stress UspA family protein